MCYFKGYHAKTLSANVHKSDIFHEIQLATPHPYPQNPWNQYVNEDLVSQYEICTVGILR